MGKGGSTSVKETSYQKAQADVAQSQWDLYQNELKEYENLFIDKVDDLNDESNYSKVAGDAATQTTSAFTDARQQLSDGLTASGVDPSSGKYQAAMDDITQKQAGSQIDTVSRAQNDQADKYAAGLSDVVALGQGEKADSLEGYSTLARSSGQKAIGDAEAAYNEKASMMNALGTFGGADTDSKMNAAKTSKINTASTINGNTGAIKNPYLVSGVKH